MLIRTSEEKILIALKWMVKEDSTFDQPGNEYWISGYEFSRKVLCEVSGETYEPNQYKNWDISLLKDFEDALYNSTD